MNGDAQVSHLGCVVHSTPRHYCESCCERAVAMVKELEEDKAILNQIIENKEIEIQQLKDKK